MFKFLTGINPLALYFAGGLMLAAMIGTGFVVHRFDDAAKQKMIAGYAMAQAKAIEQALKLEKKQNSITLAAAVADAAAQEKIVVHTQVVTREIVRHVKDTSTCISFGFVRVLDAEVLGVAPADLALPAGQSDDACAPVTPSALAEHVAANYGRARQNARQLEDLEDYVLDLLAAGRN